MGADADAKIIYGFPFEGDDFAFHDEAYDNDPEIWLATHQGLPKPEGSYDSNPDVHRGYYDARKTLPLDTAYDGDLMGGHTTHYLCVSEASLSGDWCGGTIIPEGHIKMPPPPEWDDFLRAFCEKSGVPWQQPEWLLIVNYG